MSWEIKNTGYHKMSDSTLKVVDRNVKMLMISLLDKFMDAVSSDSNLIKSLTMDNIESTLEKKLESIINQSPLLTINRKPGDKFSIKYSNGIYIEFTTDIYKQFKREIILREILE